eukprot:2027663-Pleurochrysis_carterae.AAC.2
MTRGLDSCQKLAAMREGGRSCYRRLELTTRKPRQFKSRRPEWAGRMGRERGWLKGRRWNQGEKGDRKPR